MSHGTSEMPRLFSTYSYWVSKIRADMHRDWEMAWRTGVSEYNKLGGGKRGQWRPEVHYRERRIGRQ